MCMLETPEFLEGCDERRLFLGVKAIIFVDAEDEIAVADLFRAREELGGIGGLPFGDGIELGPHFADAQVGVRIEARDEFSSLVQHVGFDPGRGPGTIPKWSSG